MCLSPHSKLLSPNQVGCEAVGTLSSGFFFSLLWPYFGQRFYFEPPLGRNLMDFSATDSDLIECVRQPIPEPLWPACLPSCEEPTPLLILASGLFIEQRQGRNSLPTAESNLSQEHSRVSQQRSTTHASYPCCSAPQRFAD